MTELQEALSMCEALWPEMTWAIKDGAVTSTAPASIHLHRSCGEWLAMSCAVSVGVVTMHYPYAFGPQAIQCVRGAMADAIDAGASIPLDWPKRGPFSDTTPGDRT